MPPAGGGSAKSLPACRAGSRPARCGPVRAGQL